MPNYNHVSGDRLFSWKRPFRKPAVVTYDDVKVFVADIAAGGGYFINKMLYICIHIHYKKRL